MSRPGACREPPPRHEPFEAQDLDVEFLGFSHFCVDDHRSTWGPWSPPQLLIFWHEPLRLEGTQFFLWRTFRTYWGSLRFLGYPLKVFGRRQEETGLLAAFFYHIPTRPTHDHETVLYRGSRYGPTGLYREYSLF